MANQRRPIAQMLVAPATGPAVKYDGFGRYDIVDEALRQGRCQVNYLSSSAAGPASGGGTVPAAMAVTHGKLRCVVARPLLDTAQAIGLGHFDRQGGTWLALREHGIGNEVKLYQSDGTPNQTVEIVSRFTLPRNPVFCVSLYRAEPGPDYDWQGTPPYTEVHFGMAETDEWCLSFPYCGPMSVLRNRGDGWKKVAGSERTVHVPTLEGFARGQRLFVWVAVWAGRLVISTDGFAEDVWVYEAPGEVISIPQGKVAVSHNAGQMMTSLFPIKMTTAVLDSDRIEAGYETQQSQAELILNYRHLPVSGADGQPLSAVAVTDTTSQRSDLSSTQRAWRATIPPWLHRETGIGVDPDTGASVDFATCVSPELYSVQVGQYAQLLDAEQPEWVDVSNAVADVARQHRNASDAGRYQVVLDATPEALAGLKPWRRARISLGWCDQNGVGTYTDVGTGHIGEATYVLGPGGSGRLEATLDAALTRLRDEKCDGRTPAFDGWPVAEVFAWALGRCGIRPQERAIEDTGVILDSGTPERPLWLPEPGREWLEFLAEVARFDFDAGLFCDAQGRVAKACRYCRQPRTAADVQGHDGTASGSCPSDTEWHLFTRAAGVLSADGWVEILELTAPGSGSAASRAANYVVVRGLSPDGTPLQAIAADAASIDDPGAPGYVGWRRMTVLSLDACTGQSDMDRLAGELLRASEEAGRPVTVKTPLTPGMQIGQVVQLHGAAGDELDGHRYRISSLAHRANRSGHEPATTTVGGRWIADS